MSWGAVASVAATVITSEMSKDAAGDAADAQSQSSAAAVQEQRRQFDLARSDNAPFLKTGTAANKRLAQLLGLDTDAGGATSLVSTQKGGGGPTFNAALIKDPEYYTAWQNLFGGPGQGDSTTWDPAALEASLRSNLPADYLAKLDGQNKAAQAPDSGSLLRKFSADDLAADPVYNSGLDFGLKEGEGAINARAIAGGGYDSGATLKALTRFANDYGSTKANDSFNRYNATNDSIFNKLAGISGTGQAATAQVGAAGQNMASNVSDLVTGAGNARAAGIVGGANAYSNAASGINSAYNNYQQNETLKKLLGGRTTTYSLPSNSGEINWGDA